MTLQCTVKWQQKSWTTGAHPRKSTQSSRIHLKEKKRGVRAHRSRARQSAHLEAGVTDASTHQHQRLRKPGQVISEVPFRPTHFPILSGCILRVRHAESLAARLGLCLVASHVKEVQTLQSSTSLCRLHAHESRQLDCLALRLFSQLCQTNGFVLAAGCLDTWSITKHCSFPASSTSLCPLLSLRIPPSSEAKATLPALAACCLERRESSRRQRRCYFLRVGN
ncbi:uncharacterized protein J3D65DRAFT_371383 [Phyllosticta citribraziliensis]|uniref:Uncharacterized protein n=1 Tax=Phyllosticta citribraziliensis TaxID=989973 RepID=A0ABR1LT59_9PEZI